ncbi:unnamed protein product [Lactuca virosa]|uniref:Uncharacterized protein n=1 Tax=Lactuca virosa TaxID=75947 RepID=A0AAU9MY80_9ASTR|nr:unnamed protein product [Lactuca virosa]
MIKCFYQIRSICNLISENPAPTQSKQPNTPRRRIHLRPHQTPTSPLRLKNGREEKKCYDFYTPSFCCRDRFLLC